MKLPFRRRAADRPTTSARRAALALATAALATAACGDLPLTPLAEQSAASRAVDSWVQRHQTEWKLGLESGSALVRPAWSQPCAANPPSGFTVLRFAASETEIDLLFRCPVNAGASVQELQAAFAYMVLQRLPHGIESPGWEFVVQTPTSSFSQGVTFHALAPGRLRVAVETPLYSVFGRSLRDGCIPPADAPLEPECYVHREHRIPLRLTLEVPFNLSGLD